MRAPGARAVAGTTFAVVTGALALALLASAEPSGTRDRGTAPEEAVSSSAVPANDAVPSAEPEVVDEGSPIGPPTAVQTPEGVRVVRPTERRSDLHEGFALAAGTGAEAIANIGSNETGETATRLLVRQALIGVTLLVRTVPGDWEAPTRIRGGAGELLSWDGSRAVLQDLDDRGRLLAVRTDDPGAEPLGVRPRGRFAYEALSSDGDTLFLRQSTDDAGLGPERIRAVDLRSGRLLPEPVADAATGDAATTGSAVARTVTRALTYTVYVGDGKARIEALGAGPIRFSIGLPLPDGADPAAARGAWTLAASVDGRTLVAASGGLAMAYTVGANGEVVAIPLEGHADGPPAVAVGSAQTAYVLADAGLERLNLATGEARTVRTPRGMYGLLATGDGVLALGGDWTPIGRLQRDGPAATPAP
jgi:hypothetical protein